MRIDIQDQKTYKKSLGIFELVSLGVGGTIGSGIFVVPGIAASIAGPSSLIAWLIVGISAACVMLSLAWASSRYPSTGAFYTIFLKGFGKKTSALLVMLYLISSVFGISTIASGLGQYFSFFGFQSPLSIEILIIIVFCILNLRGARASSNVEIILTTIKTIPLIILAFLLIPYIKTSNFIPFSPGSNIDFLKAIIIVYWPFTGFEISAIPSEETKGQNTTFKSLIIVMSIVIFTYILLNISLIGSVGSGLLAASPAPIATASGMIFGNSEKFIAVIGIIAMMSALNAYMVGTSRVMQNLSLRFNVPLLRDLNKRGIPDASIILSAFLSAALLFYSNHFSDLASISVITTLIPYIFICLCAYKIFNTKKIRLIAGIGAISTLAILVISFLI